MAEALEVAQVVLEGTSLGVTAVKSIPVIFALTPQAKLELAGVRLSEGMRLIYKYRDIIDEDELRKLLDTVEFLDNSQRQIMKQRKTLKGHFVTVFKAYDHASGCRKFEASAQRTSLAAQAKAARADLLKQRLEKIQTSKKPSDVSSCAVDQPATIASSVHSVDITEAIADHIRQTSDVTDAIALLTIERPGEDEVLTMSTAGVLTAGDSPSPQSVDSVTKATSPDGCAPAASDAVPCPRSRVDWQEGTSPSASTFLCPDEDQVIASFGRSDVVLRDQRSISQSDPPVLHPSEIQIQGDVTVRGRSLVDGVLGTGQQNPVKIVIIGRVIVEQTANENPFDVE